MLHARVPNGKELVAGGKERKAGRPSKGEPRACYGTKNVFELVPRTKYKAAVRCATWARAPGAIRAANETLTKAGEKALPPPLPLPPPLVPLPPL